MTSKADKQRFDSLQRIGCIACRKEGRYSQVDIHHLVDKGTRKHSGGNSATLPLCPWHHRGFPPDGMRINVACSLLGPCLAKHKKHFIQRYGTERELLAEVDALVTPMTNTDRLRREQRQLRDQKQALEAELITVECKLIRVDRQLGEINDYNQPGSGRDTTGVP